MAKYRSLGVVLIILGVLVNNYAYVTDVVGNTHDGLIYMGWKGMVAAVAGLVSVVIGTVTLFNAGKQN